MAGTYFIIGFAILVFLLVATRRKSSKVENSGNRNHGKFKKFVREREKSRGFGNDSTEVFYREDNEPFAKSAGPMSLADDPHGVYGEAATSAMVERAAFDSGCRFYVFQNVYIPTHAGYTELDTVLLHETGIYVFETKNVSGEVRGDLEQDRWNLFLNKRIEHTLYNPLKQNQGHIGALLRQLRVGYERARVYSFVVFSDRCVLVRVPARGANWQVVHLGELRNALGKVMRVRSRVHDKRRLEEWRRTLASCVNVSEQVKLQHKAQIQSRKNESSP